MDASVKRLLDTMSMEETVGQLICPEDRNYSAEDWLNILAEVPVGSVFLGGKAAEVEARCRLMQAHSRIPMLIAADMEHGAVMLEDRRTEFPWAMALGAIGDPEAAYRMGVITAKESRARGIHWTFSPVADLNLNFNNPVTNIRALGDDPARTIPLLTALIAGLQEGNRMAATAKHFPGDGVDDRDQHMCTSVNSLPVDQWSEWYGRVWKAVFDAGVMSVMAGHISFPAWEGLEDDCDTALPATLSRKLQIDLLRGKLGFDGVLVSDAMPMVGFTSRARSEDLAWMNIQAGSDVVLFANPRRDFKQLMAALKDGRLSEERVYESAARVLQMKRKLGLFEDCFGPAVSAGEAAEYAAEAQSIADRSIALLREEAGVLPVTPVRTPKVLTVTLCDQDLSDKLAELPVVDEELRRRGFEVAHLRNPGHRELMKATAEYDRIFVNILTRSHAAMGSLRLSRHAAMSLWRSFFTFAPGRVCFTSFGSPYFLYDLPAIPNYMAAWGMAEVSQRAAVKVWCGEIPAAGSCPVRLPKKRVARWEF